jgi:anthranilate phosphoribosyltransferase
MREHSHKVRVEGTLLDIVGTGGDGANTLNFSTAASILAAACGCMVAKHGNRSVSSLSGSADVLEKLGVQINLDADGTKLLLERAGIAFMFAPNFHPAFKNVVRSVLASPALCALVCVYRHLCVHACIPMCVFNCVHACVYAY